MTRNTTDPYSSRGSDSKPCVKRYGRHFTYLLLLWKKQQKYYGGIRAIPVKSPMRIVYGSESDEAGRIINEIWIKLPDRILIWALPESGYEYKKTSGCLA
jgi:hypothetical protein